MEEMFNITEVTFVLCSTNTLEGPVTSLWLFGPLVFLSKCDSVQVVLLSVLLLTIPQRRAQRAATQLSAAPVFSVEEAGWKDTCIDGNVADNEEQDWTERENGTVFVIPTSPRAPDGHCRWEYLKGGDPDCTSLGWISELQDGDTTTLGSSSEDTLSRDLERVSLGSLGKWTWDIHSIILDFSTANFIDTVAIKTMKNVSSKGT